MTHIHTKLHITEADLKVKKLEAYEKTEVEKKCLSWERQCCCSVTKLCPTLRDPMNCSTPGFPVLHHLPEFAQTHVHWVGGAIQPSHPQSFPSPALNLSQCQGFFQWVGSSHQVAQVLELQHQSFQWIFRVDFLSDWLVWSPCSPRDSQEFSPAPQFKSINSSALSLLYGPTLTSVNDHWKNHSVSCFLKGSLVELEIHEANELSIAFSVWRVRLLYVSFSLHSLSAFKLEICLFF